MKTFKEGINNKSNDASKQGIQEDKQKKPLDLSRPQYHLDMKNYHENMRNRDNGLPEVHDSNNKKMKDILQDYSTKYKELANANLKVDRLIKLYEEEKLNAELSGLNLLKKRMELEHESLEERFVHFRKVHGGSDSLFDVVKEAYNNSGKFQGRKLADAMEIKDAYAEFTKHLCYYGDVLAPVQRAENNVQRTVFERNNLARQVEDAILKKQNLEKLYADLKKAKDLNTGIELLDNQDGKASISNLREKLEIIHEAESEVQQNDSVIAELEHKVTDLSLKEETLNGKKLRYEIVLESMKVCNAEQLIIARNSLASEYSCEALDEQYILETPEVLREQDFQDEWLFADSTKGTCEEIKNAYQKNLKDLEKLQKKLIKTNGSGQRKIISENIIMKVNDILESMDQEIRGIYEYKSSLLAISAYTRNECANLEEEYNKDYEMLEDDIDKQLKILKSYNNEIIKKFDEELVL